jgi:hypothetical protein
VKLTVRVTQMGTTGPIMVSMPNVVALTNLPELDTKVTSGTALAALYSRVKLTDDLTFAPKVGGSAINIEAVSSVELANVHVDASGVTPGSGGATGGAALKIGFGFGGGLPGSLIKLGGDLNLLAAGSGGGYGQSGGAGKATLGADNAGGAVSGDELIRTFTNNTGSGGGGGGSNPGGGGGGSLMITAGGNLTAGTITANGGAGGADALLSGAAGGGSGGAIVLRSQATATLDKVMVNGGAAGSHGSTGSLTAGAGGGGRLRYDVSVLAGSPQLPAMSRPGVSFDVGAGENPLITRDPQGFLLHSVHSADAASNLFDVYVFNAAGANTDMMTVQFVGTSVVASPALRRGYNRVCVTAHGASPNDDKGITSCIDVAYAP